MIVTINTLKISITPISNPICMFNLLINENYSIYIILSNHNFYFLILAELHYICTDLLVNAEVPSGLKLLNYSNIQKHPCYLYSNKCTVNSSYGGYLFFNVIFKYTLWTTCFWPLLYLNKWKNFCTCWFILYMLLEAWLLFMYSMYPEMYVTRLCSIPFCSPWSTYPGRGCEGSVAVKTQDKQC